MNEKRYEAIGVEKKPTENEQITIKRVKHQEHERLHASTDQAHLRLGIDGLDSSGGRTLQEMPSVSVHPKPDQGLADLAERGQVRTLLTRRTM
jgi:hypothetical protein